MRTLLVLLIVLLSSCGYFDSSQDYNVNIIFEVTVLDMNNTLISNKEYNIESFKLRETPMLRTFAWQIRKTDDSGILRYYVNYDLRKGEKIRLCINLKEDKQCADVFYWEVIDNPKITKALTVKDMVN